MMTTMISGLSSLSLTSTAATCIAPAVLHLAAARVRPEERGSFDSKVFYKDVVALDKSSYTPIVTIPARSLATGGKCSLRRNTGDRGPPVRAAARASTARKGRRTLLRKSA